MTTALSSAATRPAPPNRWQRRRDRTRSALTAAALELFRTKGYDATTVDEIADAADVSPRTFFHHFATKEEVLFGGHEERRKELISTLEDRLETDSVWTATCSAMMTVVDAFETDPAFFRERARLYAREPGLRAAVLSINDRLVNEMTEVLAAKLRCRAGDLRPRLIATLANGAMRSAIDSWVSSRAGGSLRALATEALRIARPALREAVKAASSLG
ncbi:MAG: TetR family transcriptional regulator [Deltaproteobacteria bacterium]|nr:TetR family transcriptional regulator [Deltaproteobacteria bacterium]